MVTGWHLSSECQQVKIYGVSLNFRMLFVLFSNSNSSYTHRLSVVHSSAYSSLLYRSECQVSPGPPLTVTWSSPALNHHLPQHSEDAQQDQSRRNGFCAASYSPLMLHNMQPFSLAGTRGERLHLREGPTQAPRQLQWSSWCPVTCIHTPWRNIQQFCRSSWGSNSCQREGLLP